MLSILRPRSSFFPRRVLPTSSLHQSPTRALHNRAVHPAAHTIPPNHPAAIGNLATFTLPTDVRGSGADRALGLEMVNTWRRDGIFQIRLSPEQGAVLKEAFAISKGFFSRPFADKASHIDDQSFSGYIASGEELTDGIADYSEIFTVTKDLPLTDPRVRQRWPCHGPCPWPNKQYQETMNKLMFLFGQSGEKLLQLTALGLRLANPDAFNHLTADGWHHMRILRFPHVDKTNGKGKAGRGIGSHTDYGLLVLAGQDSVGGLFVRPPVDGERTRNWESSAAGLHENDKKWTYVPPVDNVLTVFPGDMMQYMTNDYLMSTPHKVGLNTSERFAFAYFHEPNFTSVVKPLPEFAAHPTPATEGIHYGTHFTNMFMRNYPERVTAKRVHAENRMALLDTPALRGESAINPDTPVCRAANSPRMVPFDAPPVRDACPPSVTM